MASGNPFGYALYTVTTASGSELHLQTQEEANWYENRRDRYLTDNAFPNVSDLLDLDRLLTFEVMSYRWTLWIGQGFDYVYTMIDSSQLAQKLKEASVEIRLLKASLGIDKATRDKDKGESLSDYTANLLVRAKAFGYHRNDQYELAVTMFYQLRNMVLTYDRCDEEERALLDLSMESIFEWVREDVIGRWDALADAFRANQAMWIRDM